MSSVTDDTPSYLWSVQDAHWSSLLPRVKSLELLLSLPSAPPPLRDILYSVDLLWYFISELHSPVYEHTYASSHSSEKIRMLYLSLLISSLLLLYHHHHHHHHHRYYYY